MSQRKDDHIAFALEQQVKNNDFDRFRFVHTSIPSTSLDSIDLRTTLGPFTLNVPFFINAMTGGSNQSFEINEKLAQLAKACDLAMATGSVSIALKDPSLSDAFTILSKVNPEGLRIANVGAGSRSDKLNQAVDLVNAHACQIHLNALQELIMPEGDKNFSSWWNDLEDCVLHSKVPIIVKEVGFGMSPHTILKLESLGVKMIDVSGQGGTDFAWIENQRRSHSLDFFNGWGHSTLESLLSVKGRTHVDLIASGGIRGALDIAKALASGAKAVGLSSYFLKLVTNHSLQEAITQVEQLKNELKMILCALDAHDIESLTKVDFILDADLDHRITKLKETF
ncbi:MAG: type 2 isopentenyl-diphosphate Delta-isomerase [Erysipelothrix sp.]|jgi:isopentenyl-diphosphate delta-isomerase|nr:type 2 isopentenyl-diphosphate Delta-isomerase [Erysipelothrix sp.]